MTDRDPEDIKHALRKKNVTLAGLARQHGVTKSVPTVALRQSFPKWEAIIAAVLGEPPENIWPVRYAARAKRDRIAAEIAAARARPRRRGRPPIRTTPDAVAARAGSPR